MKLAKNYKPQDIEPELQALWQRLGVNAFSAEDERPKYVIDTPPPTVSGSLHLGHVYSYSHADFFARFWRMNGRNVLYPMGYDDNGLPTERLVEKRLQIKATDLSRSDFIEKCLQVSQEVERDYEALWKRLALSIDWRYTYRTIDGPTRRLSQLSFLDLYEKGLVYRKRTPTIWCPECQTAIAQAELDDLERISELVTIDFELSNGDPIPIATTRPELLPACVAVFVHPEDARYKKIVGMDVRVPLFGQSVPLLADSDAESSKGTGAVMCCTFGDTTDVTWWYNHDLALVEAIGKDGRLTGETGLYASLTVSEARRRIKESLEAKGLLRDRRPAEQTVRVHERCDTPVEYILTWQWFVRILEYKQSFLEAGEKVKWYPDHMKVRFRQWVENLNWDWCISRQRYFGVSFPLWYCERCGAEHLALKDELPVDPLEQQPSQSCFCGHNAFIPEEDVMDTWATSSLAPQVVGSWLGQSGFDGQTYHPLSMRTQAHEIIRTWAFYSIVKAHHHFGRIPWKEAVISGWGLSPEGSGKISKSRGGGPVAPMAVIDRYSADAVRYWAASSGLGKDAIISEERIQAGSKLVTKLWNLARFSERFISDYSPTSHLPRLSPADKWILSRLQNLIYQSSESYRAYDYAVAKNLVEVFLWTEFADNYIEMAKKRLYDDKHELHEGALFTLQLTLLTIIKLFAPILSHVTEEIYLALFAEKESTDSIHRSFWPIAIDRLNDSNAEAMGKIMVEIATAVRRYKSNANISLGSKIEMLIIWPQDQSLVDELHAAKIDLQSITRATQIIIGREHSSNTFDLLTDGPCEIAIKL